jgi:hypothetical protein
MKVVTAEATTSLMKWVFLPKPSYDISPNLGVRFPIAAGKFHLGLKNVLTEKGLSFTVFFEENFRGSVPNPSPSANALKSAG